MQLLRLPPYHCHLNPIELFWSHVKDRLRNVLASTDKVEAVAAKCYEAFDEVGVHCPSDCRHVIALEEVHFKNKISIFTTDKNT